MVDADDLAFVPFATARLTIRRLAPADAAAMAAYRNDPEGARHQDWAMPYPPERAEANVAAATARSGPVPGEWWTMGVVRDGELAGDVAVHLDPTGAVATIGYTLARAHH